jgi:hypothetical protein
MCGLSVANRQPVSAGPPVESFDDIFDFDVKNPARMEGLSEIEIPWHGHCRVLRRIGTDLMQAEEHLTETQRMEKPIGLTSEKRGKSPAIARGRRYCGGVIF